MKNAAGEIQTRMYQSSFPKCKYATAHQKQPRHTFQLGPAPIESLRLLEALLRLEPRISFTLQNLLFLRTNSIEPNLQHHQQYTVHCMATRRYPERLKWPKSSQGSLIVPPNIFEQFQSATRKMWGGIRAVYRLWDTTSSWQGTEAPFWENGIEETTPSVEPVATRPSRLAEDIS